MRGRGVSLAPTRTWPRIPKGFRPPAQGCEARATLGNRRPRRQPQRGCGSIPGLSQLHDKCLKSALVQEKWIVVIGGDHEVKADDRQIEVEFSVTFGRNPVGVETLGFPIPRVARASQPWALGRNPFGISSRICPNSRVGHPAQRSSLTNSRDLGASSAGPGGKMPTLNGSQDGRRYSLLREAPAQKRHVTLAYTARSTSVRR